MPADPSAAERARLLKATELFASLSAASLAGVARAAAELRLEPGSVVVREGEPGDGLYVVMGGDVQVYLARSDRGEIVLALLGAGDVFGERYPLEEGGRRTASVRCRTAARLLHVDEASYRALVERHPEIARRVRLRGEQYDEARVARRSELGRLLDVERPTAGARTRRYAAGAVVFREGDAADGFYFIVSGRASVHAEATPETPIRVLEPGQGFGELALLNDAPRSASVRAESDLEVQLIPRAQFLRAHEWSAEVRDRMAALSFAYRLPSRGVALQWVGRRGEHESIERTYRLDDGRTWSSSFLAGGRVFRLEATSIDASAGATEHAWRDAATGLARTVRVDRSGRITALFGVGPWGRLPALIEAAFDGTPLDAARFASFQATGAVHFDAPRPLDRREDRTVCYCMQVPRSAVHAEIRAGCQTFEELRGKTGCGSVCGGCEPAVKELLGNVAWTPVTAKAIPLRDDLRCFRLYPRGRERAPFAPGQHVVVEGFIEGNWIARAYTIISSPEETRYLEICVQREREGLFSRWLFTGDLDDKALHVSAPRGDARRAAWSTPEAAPAGPSARPTVCFAGGIGVTPALAMVRAALASAGRPRVHVDWSARDASRLVFRDELDAAAASRDHITVRQRATGVEGRITADQVSSTAREHPDAAFHVCGPEAFERFVRAALLAAGVDAARIEVERFVHAGAPAARPEIEPAAPAKPPSRRARSLAALAIGALIATALGACYFATLVQRP